VRFVALVVALLFVAFGATAQSASAPMPARSAAPTSGSGKASPAGSAKAAPAGSANGTVSTQPTPAEGAPAGDPHANPHGELARDSSMDDPELPPGTIEVLIADPTGRPLGSTDVRLGILSQKIAEGESRSEKTAKTDENGRVRFTALAATTDKVYSVAVKAGPAEYASPPFNLRDNAGHRVLLHVYPSTSDMTRTVVFGAFMSVEPRDDLFQLDMVLHVFNVSRMGWIPSDVVIDLPEGFKAFLADESSGSNSRFEVVEGRGAMLRGTFPPGERRVKFRFQVPKPPEREVSFRIGFPQRVVQAQVVAAAGPEMSLEVREGFPPPQVDESTLGDRVLITARRIKSGEDPIRELVVSMAGLRVPGVGRWVAVFIALAFAGFGGLAARGDLRIASTERVQGDRARARELILRELVDVEHAKDKGDIGPNAYERAHRSLVDALARIGIPDEKKPTKKRKALRS
jgi:hypothetical protein